MPRNSSRPYGRTAAPGVRYHLTRRQYGARLVVDGKEHSLGFFDTRDEAVEARRLASIRLKGEPT